MPEPMRSRATTITACVAAFCGVVVAGCGSGGSTSTLAARPAPFACPRVTTGAGLASYNPRPGTEEELVPGRPTRLLVCLYHGLTPSDPQRLTAERRTTEGAAVETFARYLHGTSGFGDEGCPGDIRSEALLLFGYRSGPPALVEVSLEGCQWAGNGRAPSVRLVGVGEELITFVAASGVWADGPAGGESG
jgi:hypothetical protein